MSFSLAIAKLLPLLEDLIRANPMRPEAYLLRRKLSLKPQLIQNLEWITLRLPAIF